jgi:lipoprotein-anchoring transpeptidase ErfK/SrfK
MAKPISRRGFLKLAGLSLGGLAFDSFPPGREDQNRGLVGRVTIASASVYREPLGDAQIVAQRFRDELVPLYYELTPPEGPAYNPLWYRVWGGYMHSAYLQRTDIRYNSALRSLPEAGQLVEVTVPYTQSWQFSRFDGWRTVNRLYYQSTHWATAIEAGPDGRAWYQLTSELWDVDYFVPASHLRPIPDDELTPLSPDVPPEDKRIEIRLGNQTLTAFEGDRMVLRTTISSGIPSRTPGPNGIPTATPTGQFNIYSKLPSKHMGQGRLTDDLDDYVLLGVPWTSFFYQTGVALHGTYWHNNFGLQMSHGCINMRNEEAKWLFRWTTPVNPADSWEKRGRGTRVDVL